MATPTQWRRRRRLSLLVLTAIAALVATAVAFGAVSTDQQDYAPGTVVTISGSNDATGAPGYVEGQTVDVTATNTTTGWVVSCPTTTITAADGSWSCQLTLSSDESLAVGSYTYAATSTDTNGNPIDETGTFTDKAPDDTATSWTSLPGSVIYGDPFTFTASVTDTTDGTVAVDGGGVGIDQNRSAAHDCGTGQNYGAPSELGVGDVSGGSASLGPLDPGSIAFPASSGFTAGSYYVSTPPSVGTYGFVAEFDPLKGHHTTTKFKASTSPCALLTVNKASTTTSNSHTANNGTADHIYYGQSDTVNYVVSSSHGVTGNTMYGSVALTRTDVLSSNPSCTPASQSISAAQTTGTGFSYDSSGAGGLPFTCMPHQATASPYTFYAAFTDNSGAALNPDGNYTNSDASGSPLSLYVDQAPTSTTASLSSSSITLGNSVFLNYEVSSDYGISGNTMYGSTTVATTTAPGGGLAHCLDGSSSASTSISASQGNDGGTTSKGGFDYAADGSNNTTHRFTCTPNVAGTYVLEVHFTDNPNSGLNPDGNYQDSKSSGQTLTVVLNVLPATSFTSEGLCPFSNGATHNQFRLIYTPDTSSANPASYYKLNASNPGQFSYNIDYPADSASLPTWVKNYFVTQGAMPVKIYAGATVLVNGCVQPGNLIASETVNGDGTITIPNGVASAYITVHLDFKFKGLGGITKLPNGTAAFPGSPLPTLGSCSTPTNLLSPCTYATLGSQTITSVNVFKNDPGIGGLVTSANDGTPIAGAQVEIDNSSGQALATVTTDSDGWYMWNYKYTGKAATFTVKLVGTSQVQTVTLKSNGFLVVNFTE